jgi:hypothetical protein
MIVTYDCNIYGIHIHFIIINDYSRVTLLIVASFTIVIYECNVFIVQAITAAWHHETHVNES